MRVVPAPGLVLRDPRTKLLVDPELGVEVGDHDLTFAWLLDQGDVVPLSDDAYAAAQAKRDAADKLVVAEHLAAAAADPVPEPQIAQPAPAKPPAPAAADKGVAA